MEKQTEYKIGNRCHICTGCGQCPGTQQNMHVLAEASQEIAESIRASMPNDGKPMRYAVGSNERLIAVDIGTTTIAMQLYGRDGEVQDTFAVVNPQAEYGADVLSRIQAAKNPEIARRMQGMVREVLCQGIQQFRIHLGEQEHDGKENGKHISDESFHMVIAANTTMVYLLMGYDTAELGEAPFHASHLQPIETVIEEVPCYIVPGLSAFVGGDIVAGIVACGMYQKEELTLLIDLGTNGEIVLGNKDKILACATAAGPAFEGGVNRGVWGADMVSLLARLRREGILDETGLLAESYFEQGVGIGNVCVTQEAVRAIQLAKGAIVAGVKILAEEYGISLEQIDRVLLAGGFGYYLNPQDAADIGLLPKELKEKTFAGGNTALLGASKIGYDLLAGEMREISEKLCTIRENASILNLAEIKTFHELYFASMDLI